MIGAFIFLVFFMRILMDVSYFNFKQVEVGVRVIIVLEDCIIIFMNDILLGEFMLID